jgi:hydroxymethylpyrimidine/phosphomethylpyrimidine kinase
VSRAIPRVLAIAGSDSGGGAGIQADLKAFASRGTYGLSAITAVTAQNTAGLLAIHAVPPRIVCAQIESVVEDIGVDAVKIGMLVDAATVRAVARCLSQCLDAATPIVLDPVLSASTGATLLAADAVEVLLSELFPRVTVLTPNLPEARALAAHAGRPRPTAGDDGALARELLALGPDSIVLTGGHRARAGDLYCDAEQLVELGGEHYDTDATHGSGCTHSAVLAAELASGRTPLEAARTAAVCAAAAIRDGLDGLGQGSGPVDVLGLWQREGTS